MCNGTNYDDFSYTQDWFELIYPDEADCLHSASQEGFYYADTAYHWNGVTSAGTSYARLLRLEVKTQVKLWTGGKAGVARQSLFGVQCAATEWKQPPVGYLWEPWAATMYPWPTMLANQWQNKPGAPIDPASLEILGKHPGADGKLWTTLPDNAGQDFTIIAKGIKHFGASASPGKYKLHILANNYLLADDRVRPGAYYCVGKKLSFAPAWSPALPETPQESPIQWALGGTFVNKSWQVICGDELLAEPCGSVNYTNDPALLKTETTHAWWVSGGPDANTPATYNATLGMGLTFQNGQYVAIATHGQFNMWRPKAVMYRPRVHGTPAVVWTTHWTYLEFGDIAAGIMSVTNNIDYWLHIISPKFGGTTKFTQICTIYSSLWPIYTFTDELDAADAYPGDRFFTINANSNPTGNVNAMFLEDAPDGSGFHHIYLYDSFTDYIMFTPGGSDDIYVPLGKVLWSASGEATYSSSTISPNSVVGPSNPDSSYDWPVWINVFPP
jgi:hypothetical protein